MVQVSGSLFFSCSWLGFDSGTKRGQPMERRSREDEAMIGPDEVVPNEQLLRARSLKGWSQAKLAEKVGTSFELVSRWERGITVPSPYYRERLCAVLDKTAEELGLVRGLKEPFTAPSSPLVLLASSYADAEKAIVTRLKTALQERRFTLWSSRQLSRQGIGHSRTTLREVVRAAQVILVIVSPEARASRHIREALELARMYQRPVCAVWIEGEHWQECLPKGGSELAVPIDARMKDDSTLIKEVATALERVGLAPQDSDMPTLTGPEVWAPTIQSRNPYKGLRAFRGEDRPDFFGREALIEELTVALQASLSLEKTSTPSARLLAVMGPSGSGKSSVVLAGLLPHLQAGGLSGSEAWVYFDPIVLGAHPLESLALALAAHLPDRSLHTLGQDLESDSARGLHLLAAAVVEQREANVVLFVDQFEEVFSQTTPEEERRHFLDLLVTAVTEPQGPVIVILTLRADFSDRPMLYPEFSRLLETHFKTILPMEIEELRAIIEQPAALPDVHLTFEGTLVGDLLFEARGQVGALPLLEFTLTQLFERRRGQALTLEAYHAMGGIKGALAQHAEETYASLPSEEHRRLARALFLRLIDPGATMQDTTRRRIAQSELMLSSPKETVFMEEVARAFTTARLLITDMVSGVATVEISHEAVIREWTRLAGWLDEAHEDVHRQQTISEDAAEWERHGKPRERLYRGTRLKEAQVWAKRNTPSGDEAAFLRLSAVRQTRSRINVAAICLLIVLLFLPAGLQIRQIFFPPNATTVTTLADNGQGSLRQAIDNATPGGIVTFDTHLKGVIRLMSNINIGKNLTIRGPGVGNLSIVGNGEYNVVEVEPWASVTISDLAFNGTDQIRRGYGIIINFGTLSLTNCMVSGNTTSFGSGGISNYGGDSRPGSSGKLRLTNCIISGNETEYAFGGGIRNYSGSITILNSRISYNSAEAGAGIFNNGGSLTLSNSTVSDNSAYEGYGGGILNVNGGKLTLTNSAILHNKASGGWGGGINNDYTNAPQNPGFQVTPGGPLSLINTTISDNTATHAGGIFVGGSQATITFCTIYGNTAIDEGGGIAIGSSGSDQPSEVEMRNTLVAGDHASSSPDIAGTLTSKGYNLIQNVSGAAFTRNKQHFTDVSVNPPADVRIDPALSSSPTQTHALLPGSPAIDQIPLDACLVNGITTDQRGMKRPDGKERSCDIGAYEYTDRPA
jgi:transcriptional regulator with XRE-family HTH domain